MNENRLAWLNRPEREHPIAIREAGCIHYVTIDHAQELVSELALAIIAYKRSLAQSAQSAKSADGGADA